MVVDIIFILGERVPHRGGTLEESLCIWVDVSLIEKSHDAVKETHLLHEEFVVLVHVVLRQLTAHLIL